jgi:hypothetical protein
MNLAKDRTAGAWKSTYITHTSLGLNHIIDMHVSIKTEEMSDTKLCRWLGWMQAAIVSWGIATLEDMKEINKRNAD